jgi:hypothetical protein
LCLKKKIFSRGAAKRLAFRKNFTIHKDALIPVRVNGGKTLKSTAKLLHLFKLEFTGRSDALVPINLR